MGAATAHELLVLVGGTDADVDRARPVLATYGDPIVHLGPFGSGQLAKLINNALMAAQLGLADDALRIGTALGLAPPPWATPSTTEWRQLLAPGPQPDGARPEAVAAVRLLRKDVDILAVIAERPAPTSGRWECHRVGAPALGFPPGSSRGVNVSGTPAGLGPDPPRPGSAPDSVATWSRNDALAIPEYAENCTTISRSPRS